MWQALAKSPAEACLFVNTQKTEVLRGVGGELGKVAQIQPAVLAVWHCLCIHPALFKNLLLRGKHLLTFIRLLCALYLVFCINFVYIVI